MRKPDFCICENKAADQLCGNRTADQRLCFRYVYIEQTLFYLNPKFQVSSHLLWLCSPVCVGPGRKSRRPVFSQRGSYHLDNEHQRGAFQSDLPLCCSHISEADFPMTRHNHVLSVLFFYPMSLSTFVQVIFLSLFRLRSVLILSISPFLD